MVPVALGQQQKRGALGAIGVQEGQGFRFDGTAEFAPLPVQAFTLPSQFQGPVVVLGGEQLHNQLGIPQAPHRIDPWRDLETHGLGIEGAVVEPGQLLQRLQARQRALDQVGQPIDEPATIHPHQGGHVGDGADAKKVSGHFEPVLTLEALAEGCCEHIGQSNPRQTPVGRINWGSLRMQEGQVWWHLGRERVVVREDHLNAQLLGPLQGFLGRNPVVDGDQ